MKSDSLAISPASLTTAVMIRITTHLGGLSQLICSIYGTVQLNGAIGEKYERSMPWRFISHIFLLTQEL